MFSPQWWLEVLRLCRQGDQNAAVALYQRHLASRQVCDIPVGFHARLLDGGGYGEAAARILEAGRLIGADVSSCALARGGDLRQAVTEYRALFNSGVGTSTMVLNYMICLSKLGESRELAAVASPELMFQRDGLRLPDRILVEPLLRAAAAALLGAKERQSHNSYRSARNLDRVDRTHQMEDAAVRELHHAIRVAVSEYIRRVAGAGHLISAWVPAEFELRSWAMISEGPGHNEPHVHCPNWVSGVLYIDGTDPTVAADGEAGMLRVGAAVGGDPECLGWPDFAVAPVPGTIVLMPSFYTHWTVPLGRPGSTRISLAFNAVTARE